VARHSKVWWKYVNLLGLDAPLVAVLWLLLFAKSWRVDYHPLHVYIVLAMVAWTVRIVAKLLQSAIAGDTKSFQAIHRKCLSRVALIAGIIACGTVIVYFPLAVYNYILVGSIFVIGYFSVTLFTSSTEGEIPYARHLLAGTAFSFGVTLMAHTYLPALGIKDLLISSEFICFTVLCMIASSAVDQWARSTREQKSESRLMEELTISLPLTLLGAAALVFAVQSDSMMLRPFYYAILTGSALLQILNRLRSRFTIDQQKALVNLSLLMPGLVFQAYGPTY
jgi:hypothetical protein